MTCPHKWPTLPLSLTGPGSHRFQCELCGKIGTLADIYPAEESKPAPPQGICNYCRGKISPSPPSPGSLVPVYVCEKCGRGPEHPDPMPPSDDRIAMSYQCGLHRQGEKKCKG